MAPELAAVLGPSFQMWAIFALIAAALALYASERLPMEVTSFAVICVLLVFFQVFPVAGADGENRLGPVRILQGFANPALVTVVALLVMGEGMARTGILDRGARLLLGPVGRQAWLSMIVVLAVVLVVSAFLNNIPVVVIFIPIMQALARRFDTSVSKVMIPLSFAAVLGGMTTLVGSSTNLLVNGALIEMKVAPFAFFGFTVPGLVMAAAGLVYVLALAPRLLPERAPLAQALLDGGGKQFIAQITVSEGSDLVGAGAPGGLFTSLLDMTVRMVQRGETAVLPPFEDFAVRPADVLVVAATRQALTDALSGDPGLLYPDLHGGGEGQGEGPWGEGERVLAEVMVAPASRLIGLDLPQIGFRYKTRCIVLGIQRRARMIRSRLTDIRLEAGDVLLVQGQPDDVAALRRNRDVVLIEWSAEELPALEHARRASLIFAAAMVAVRGSQRAPGDARHGSQDHRHHRRGARPRRRPAGDRRRRLSGAPPGRRPRRRRPGDGAVPVLPPGGGTVQPHQHQDDGGAVHAHRRRHRPGRWGWRPRPSPWPWSSPPTARSPRPSATRPTCW